MSDIENESSDTGQTSEVAMISIMRDGVLVQVPAEYISYTPDPVPVPQSVTRAQAKLALLEKDLLGDAALAISQAGPEAEIYWNDALNFQRTNPYIISIGTALNQTPEQIDDLFRLAATKGIEE